MLTARTHVLPLILLMAIVAAGVVTSTGSAAVPPSPRATYVFQDHHSRGDGWHIQLTVSRDSGWLSQLVMHSERCDATILTSRVKVRDGGRIASSKEFTTGDGRRGRWSLDAEFVDRRRLAGTLHVTTTECDGGVREFTAQRETGAGGREDGDHRHGGRGGHADHHEHISGTRPGRYPNFARSTAAQRAQARRLWKRSLAAARTRFTSERASRALGYRSLTIRRRPPLLFHLRHSRYASDGVSFDAARVESLVYWRPRRGRSILIGFMYRLPMGVRPAIGGPLLGWHRHGTKKGMGNTKMAHVWLTGDLRTALANCLPVAALQRTHARFNFDERHAPTSPESAPCPRR